MHGIVLRWMESFPPPHAQCMESFQSPHAECMESLWEQGNHSQLPHATWNGSMSKGNFPSRMHKHGIIPSEGVLSSSSGHHKQFDLIFNC